jgi:DNA-binding transcriptional ArsR family regulator
MSIWHKTWAYEQHPLQVDKQGNPKPHTRNPAAKSVLVALAEFPGVHQRECWPGQATLADMTDYEERTVRKHMDALEGQGYIKRTKRYRDGKRITDMVSFLGPMEAYGPPKKQPAPDSGRTLNLPESDVKPTGTSDRGTVREPSGKNPSVPEGDAGASSSVLVAYLAEELDGHDIPLMRGRKGRYGKDFTAMLKRGVPMDVMWKVVDRILERWRDDNHHKLQAEDALADVVNGKPPAHVTNNGSRDVDTGSNKEEAANRRREGYEWLFDK